VEVQVLSSAPIQQLIVNCQLLIEAGRLAQLVRALRLHRGGRRFESYSVHIKEIITANTPKNRQIQAYFLFNIDIIINICYNNKHI
jgi:hypothetical protein